jgi:probable addiction module antidote protein
MPHLNYDDFLFEDLKDLDYAAGYLTACLKEGEEVFLLGVRQVAQAQGGMRALSQSTRLNRENLYDMLSKEGNPRLSSLSRILDKLGIDITFEKKKRKRKAA